MNFVIKEISTRKEVRQFARFPRWLYKHCDQYVPGLIGEEVETLLHSPCLQYCKRHIWVALDAKGRIVGRVVGIINPRANELYHYRRVRFGWFDVIDNFEVAQALVQTVIDWGKKEGMTQVHGPLGYNTWNKQGMVVEGFENLPQFNCLYNYAYYPAFLERMGFTKEVDWLQYIMPAAQPIPEKVGRINQRILERYNLHLLKWHTARDLKPYLNDFFDTYNQSFSTVHNFIPLTKDEIKASIGFYIRLIKPGLSCFVVDENNHVVAFSITFPSLSRGLQKSRGRLFPFGWFHIIWAYLTCKDIDLMLNGAHPDWKGKGLSSVYHFKTNDYALKRKLRWAVTNPQIENNSAVEVWKEYNTKLHTRRRCFIKDI